MDPVQKALYGGVLPALLAAAIAGVALWVASRGQFGRRLAVWAVPLAAAGALLISFAGQYADVTGRWRWVIPAAVVVMLLWAAAVTIWPCGWRRVLVHSTAAAAIIAAVGGILLWSTIYERQPQWLHAVPFVALAALVAALYPAALRLANPGDGLAVAIAGAFLTPVVVFSGNAMLGELLVTTAVAAGAASLLVLIIRGRRRRGADVDAPSQMEEVRPEPLQVDCAGDCLFREEAFVEARRRISAGAIGIGLAYPMFALVAWCNSYDLPAIHAWALALPCAALPLIWVARLPWLSRHPLIGAAAAVIAVGAVAAVGLVLAYQGVEDIAVYDPGF